MKATWFFAVFSVFAWAVTGWAAVPDPMEPVYAAADNKDTAGFIAAVKRLPDSNSEYKMLKARLSLCLRYSKAASSKPRNTGEGFQVMADYCKLRGSEDAAVYQKLADAWNGGDLADIYRAVEVYYGRHGQHKVSADESAAVMRHEGTSKARIYKRRLETEFWRSRAKVLRLDHLMKTVLQNRKKVK